MINRSHVHCDTFGTKINNPEAYSESSQSSNMECFAKIKALNVLNALS